MVRVYLGIGSNIEPERHVPLALRDLEILFGSLKISTIYRNPAIGFRGDDFYNLVVGLDTRLAPLELAATLRRLEVAHGRPDNHEKLESRTLDLDLLTYGDAPLQEGRLLLPRDDIIRYAHVLRPLAEIAPDDRHPVLGARYADLWAAFDAEDEPLEPVRLAAGAREEDPS